MWVNLTRDANVVPSFKHNRRVDNPNNPIKQDRSLLNVKLQINYLHTTPLTKINKKNMNFHFQCQKSLHIN